MATTEALKAQIGSVQDLQSVVKTMKALAAVSIRQYEKAVESLADYSRTVEMGLQIALRGQYFAGDVFIPISMQATRIPSGRTGAIVFGSDQGLCGQFNEQIVGHVGDRLEEMDIDPHQAFVAAVGARVAPSLEADGISIEEQFSVPSSATGITAMVRDILLAIENWRSNRQVDKIILFYNRSTSGASSEPHHLQLLPLDPGWLRQLEDRPWPTSTLPTFTMDWQPLFSALIRDYLFVSLYRAFAESLASENASRLSSMQAAEKNIRERLSDLNSQYRRGRQSSITGELLDIVAGFEALTEG